MPNSKWWAQINHFICKAFIFPQENQRFINKVID
jgi:hypothetical protein